MKQTIVIGGGIIGLCSAYYLRQNGYNVTVIDKGDLNDNCSFGNMGYVCPSHFIPLASPGIVIKGLKWMFNNRSPFYVQPSFNSALFNWGLHFVRNANAAHVNKAAKPLRDIALLSMQEYKMLASVPGFDFAFQQNGLLEMFQTNKNADHAQHVVEKAKELGLDALLLNKEELKALEPQTKINAAGAIFFRCDGHLNPNKLMRVLKGHLTGMGVNFVAGQKVTGFEKNNGNLKKVITGKGSYDCAEVVIATGSWSREMAKMVDINLPLVPGRGYSFTMENSPYQLNYPAILTEGRVAVTPFSQSSIRFGGTMEVVPVSTPPRYQRVEGILNTVKSFFPLFNIPMPATEDIWYGYRPCSADGLPYIGRIRSFKNVIVATGHSMLGLSLGAATGKLVSQIAAGRSVEIDITPFSVERFI